MSGHIDVLRVRRTLGRVQWHTATEFGPEGWMLRNNSDGACVIVTAADQHPGAEGVWWVHASISRPDRMPDYNDLALLHRAVWGRTGYAYQAFVPEPEHVNIHHQALHLWGRADGLPVLPEFGGLIAGVKSI